MTFVWPINNMLGAITQRWGNGATGPLGQGGHPGVDFGENIGTLIKSPFDWEYLYAGPATGFGNHATCVYFPELNYSMTLGHCSAHFINPGQKGKAGDVLAATGNEGESTGPHLHLEIRPGRQAFGANPPNIDPIQFLVFFEALSKNPLPKPKPLTAVDLAKIRKVQASIGVSASGHWDRNIDARLAVLKNIYYGHPKTQQVIGLQKALGITPDGIWGKDTQAAINLWALIYRGR